MADQTEAECLLASGAMYGKRVLLRGASEPPIFAGFKTGAFSLYFGDAPIFHFDREGRWQRAYAGDRHYLKGLDTSVQTIDRVREGENLVLKRNTLGPVEVLDFDARVRSTALELIAALKAGGLEALPPPGKGRPVDPDELRAFLERVAAWDADAWADHRRRYLDTYGPLPFVPPDCPSPVILQATRGHEGGLTFGGARAVGHSVRDPGEFEAHARAVASLLGRRVEQCRSVFLGGSDLLRRRSEEVVAYLGILARVFPVDTTAGPRAHPAAADDPPTRLAGVHTFLDRFDTPWYDAGELRALRGSGLVRVSLGVESGDPGVREFYGKTWTDAALRAAVSGLKAAGIGVSVITLMGAGEGSAAARHLDATSDLINSLDLGPGDLVSLLDAGELAGVGPPRPGAGADAWKARLTPVRVEREAKVVPYSLEKQGLS